MAAIREDLPDQFEFQVAPGRTAGARRDGQGQGGKGQGDAGPQFFFPVIHHRRHRAQIAHLHGEGAHELAVGAQVSSREDKARMLQPGDNALRRDFGCPGGAANRAAMGGDPVAEQRAGIGRGKFSAGGAQVAQPAEIVQRGLPSGIGRFNQEWRAPARLHHLASKGKAAVVELFSKLWIGWSKVLRRDEYPFRCETGKTPAIKRPHAHTPAEPAPQLRCCKSPQLRCFAKRDHVAAFPHFAGPRRGSGHCHTLARKIFPAAWLCFETLRSLLLLQIVVDKGRLCNQNG